MRVLLQGRATVGERRGGDATLASQVAAELEALGHEVTVATAPPPEGMAGFDVVHAINLDRSVLTETEAMAEAAARAGCRLVVTPLWWPLTDYVAHLPLPERLAFRARGLGAARALHDRQLGSLASTGRRQARVLRAAAAVCPSGMGEAAQLRAAFGPLPIEVVQGATGKTAAPGGERSGVLCVGRLDPRKNQLGLIHALRETGIPLTCIGTGTVFPEYAERCRALASSDVTLPGFLPEQEVEEAYRRARVHALPSFFELPGLTSLDAAALGAAVVVSSAGTPRDYFGDAAWYCQTDPASIRQAVLAAYAAGPPPGLAESVASRFTWRSFAEGYLGAYRAGGR